MDCFAEVKVCVKAPYNVIFPGSRKLREAEKTAAEPRGCQQSAEEGGEGGEEEEGWV